MPAPDLGIVRRIIRRQPAYALTAILLLALGAGANAAVFSVVRGVLQRPLPYPQPERLVAFWPQHFLANEEIAYWRDRARSFDAIAGHAPGWMMALTAPDGDPIKVTGAKTSDNLFATLGAPAAIGRTLQPGDSTPGQPRVVVLADHLWRARFAADPHVLGRAIDLDREPHTVVGVMPRAFEILEPGTDLWVALPWEPGAPSFGTMMSQGIARLTPGSTAESGTRELQELAPIMRRDLARDADWGRDVHVRALQHVITGDVRPTLLILLGAVGLMLLLAAVNLGTLVLGRSVARMREMAVRTALGASRLRLVRELVAEQAALAVAGTIAGIALAYTLLPWLVARIPVEVPRAGEIVLDWTVLFVVLGVSVGAAVAVALVPALLAARPGLQPLLRQTYTTDTPGRRRALGVLVAGQIALAVVLGAGAGLMLRSLWNLQRVDPGFRADGLLTFRLQTTSKYQSLATGAPYLQEAVDRVAALPGVTAVGAVAHPPLSGYAWTIEVRRADRPLEPGAAAPRVGWRIIGWDYFGAMDIPLAGGRTFSEADRQGRPSVAIINETMARQFFGDAASAVGRMLVQYGGGRPGEEAVEIVGVARDVRHLGLEEPPVPELFRPMAQTFMFPMAFIVRTAGPPAALAGAVRQAVFDIDPLIPVAELQPYVSLVAGTLGRPRLLGLLLAVFAGAGLLLGIIGVYGVSAYRVRQHARDIGIHLALGAEPSRMARRVVAGALRHAAIGLAAGLPAAFLLARLMESVVFGVTTHDPATFLTLSLVVVLATLGGASLPASRAARVDPVVTLKAE